MSISFCFLERFLGAFLSRFSRFFNGFGALIFSPVERVAKVAIPRLIPTVCSLFGKVSGRISTTKLRKYRSACSLITVTLEGLEGNGRLQTTFKSPIFAKVTWC
jgi:hypothetical protein